MNLTGLLPLLKQLPAYQELLEQGDTEPRAVLESARPFVTAGLVAHRRVPALVLTSRQETAQRWVDRLRYFLPPPEDGGPPVYLFAEPDAYPYERIQWTDRTRQQRLTALAALQSRQTEAAIVIASVPALLQKTLPARELRLALRPLSTGSYVRLEEMIERWVQTGYEPTEVVEEPGTFARRGGIIDVWPPNLPHPVRIDLFGDEVDTLRVFDPATQRTERHIERIEIGPGGEVLSKYGPNVLQRLEAARTGHDGADPSASDEREPAHHPLGNTLLNDPNLLLAIRTELREEMESLAAGNSFRGIEWYLPYAYSKPALLLDHLPDDGLLIVDDGISLVNELREVGRRVERTYEDLRRSGEVPEGYASSFHNDEMVLEQIGWRKPLILGFGDLEGKAHSANTLLARAFSPGPVFAGETRRIVQEVDKYQKERHTVVLVSRQTARLEGELREADVFSRLQPDLDQPPPPGVTLLQGVLSDGFVMRSPDKPSSVLHLLTDAELFGWKKPPTRKKRKPQSKVAPELFFADVKPGDYVVHMEHGIGQYEGLVKLEMGGASLSSGLSSNGSEKNLREYLQVNYAQGDKLYVPVHQADRLSKYVGAGDAGIPLSVTRLGTTDWQTVKARAKKAVEDIAEDLLALYAEREVASGYAYSPDGPWQDEMESAFPFQETEDQLRAIEEVKQDMEDPAPMDRIIIGDVGYGKTEIAIRAAFKAIMDGKQVAVLVPTTVLAQQHYRTFSRRLNQFPVNVEMLSRFRTTAQQERVLEAMLEGSVDIVIGTHRLLSDDVTFKDLGLLVVDEEQRFGVSHKEKLKQLRTLVDVLTLSATPIPRTLHMSLSGVRDMSTINTPPQERLPVRTVLSEYDEVLVRQVIQRELEREGQIFFVHNRVMGLEQIANRLRRLAPDAAVGVAHGQLPERQLEEIMIRFADGEIDVLVCTTIVENGLDIRRANTMIINRADHFGLAQLYQLRGRVGRGAIRGYCYLLYDKHKSLSFDARRRLEALLESSDELGAGFRIAMRDLEIRGAGELLGAKQHGQIASVGFDLYTRLLAQSINDLKAKKERFEEAAQPDGDLPDDGGVEPAETPPSTDDAPLPFAMDDPMAPPVTLDLPIDAEIPESYVPEQGLRLQLYRRIAGLTRRDEIAEMRQELLDRFGKGEQTDSVPEEVENLLYQIEIKILALKAGIPNIGRRRDQIAIRTETKFGDSQRRTLQRRLRMALGYVDDLDIFRPLESIHVGREAVYLPIDEDGAWRPLLVRILEALETELQEAGVR